MCCGYVRTICIVVAAQAVASVAAAQSILPQQAPKNLIAAQIRNQGYICQKPISAKRKVRCGALKTGFGGLGTPA